MGSSRAPAPAPAILRAEILKQAEARGADKSICPSEVARHFGDDWQRLMTPIREVAKTLSREGLIDILRKGKPIDPADTKGVIRLRIRPPGEASAGEEPGDGGQQ